MPQSEFHGGLFLIVSVDFTQHLSLQMRSDIRLHGIEVEGCDWQWNYDEMNLM
jgi:hypothetical protein